jgi:hypothetical protein
MTGGVPMLIDCIHVALPFIIFEAAVGVAVYCFYRHDRQKSGRRP